MSLRFDRIDNVWFVLWHEIEHVLRRHGRQTPIVDSELEAENGSPDGDLPEEERVPYNEAHADAHQRRCGPRAVIAVAQKRR